MPPRRLKAVAAAPRPPDLRVAVADAIGAMTWLEKSDEGMGALALRFAGEIESAVDRAALLTDIQRLAVGDEGLYKRIQKLEAMCDLAKTVGWLGPQLQSALRDLGGTPAARAAMKPDKPIGGRLAQLRADAAAGVDAP